MQLGPAERSGHLRRAMDWTRIHVQNEIMRAPELVQSFSNELYDCAHQACIQPCALLSETIDTADWVRVERIRH